jgi:hypothetical protein
MTKLIERFNPPQLQVPMIRIIVEKLSLINMEFRPDDLSSYLFPHESKSPIEIREIFSGLSQMGIISYGTKGYGLDISLLHLARQHIQLHLTESKYQEYIGALKECQQKLISSYPNASNWYQNMIYPIDQI